MIIKPEIVVTPDFPMVYIREPEDKVDLPAELQKIMYAQGWGLGTHFRVIFIDHDRTKVLASAVFMVSALREDLQTSDVSPYQTVTKSVAQRECVLVGGFWRGADATQNDAGDDAGQQSMSVAWNPGKKVHQVKGPDGEVLAEFAKDDGGASAAQAFIDKRAA